MCVCVLCVCFVCVCIACSAYLSDVLTEREHHHQCVGIFLLHILCILVAHDEYCHCAGEVCTEQVLRSFEWKEDPKAFRVN